MPVSALREKWGGEGGCGGDDEYLLAMSLFFPADYGPLRGSFKDLGSPEIHLRIGHSLCFFSYWKKKLRMALWERLYCFFNLPDLLWSILLEDFALWESFFSTRINFFFKRDLHVLGALWRLIYFFPTLAWLIISLKDVGALWEIFFYFFPLAWYYFSKKRNNHVVWALWGKFFFFFTRLRSDHFSERFFYQGLL